MNSTVVAQSAEPEQVKSKKRSARYQFFALFLLGVMGSVAIFVIFNVLPQYTEQQMFSVNSVKTYAQSDHVLIDADLSMNFSSEVIEALENGIPLTIAVEVQVYRQRKWWPDVIIKESLQLFELAYHPLTNVHVVRNLATQDRYSFNSREEALQVLGTIRGAHLIEKQLLKPDQTYYVQIHTLLDINHLPPALRQIAALLPAWRLESNWSRWPVLIQNLKQKSANSQVDLKEPVEAQP